MARGQQHPAPPACEQPSAPPCSPVRHLAHALAARRRPRRPLFNRLQQKCRLGMYRHMQHHVLCSTGMFLCHLHKHHLLGQHGVHQDSLCMHCHTGSPDLTPSSLAVHAGNAATDPGRNPILLPPRTRADVLQDRPAGGTAEEVAAANPHLVADHPAMVGYQEVGLPPPAHDQATDSRRGGSGEGGNSSGWETADMSGVEVPELAVLPPS